MSASKLIRPAVEYQESYIEALKEFHAEGRYLYQEIAKLNGDFKGFIKDLRSEKGYPHQPYQDWVEPVPETVVWLVKDNQYIGTVDIRHRLNWHLEKWGGHVHFNIRPSMRGMGFGAKILKKAMPIINYIGIDKALITINPNDKASARIIEACGGVLEDETTASDKFPAMKRFWLDCT